jgi:hypothetical protein
MAEHTQEELQMMALEHETAERKRIFDFHYLYLEKVDGLTDIERACFVRAFKKILPPEPIVLNTPDYPFMKNNRE